MVKKLLLESSRKYVSKWIILLIDVILVSVAFIISSVIFYANFSFKYYNLYYQIPIVVAISTISFIMVGSYDGIIRHTGARDIINVFTGVSLLSLIIAFLPLIDIFFPLPSEFRIPISVVIIHYLLSNFILINSRFILRFMYKTVLGELNVTTNSLIYGAGHIGLITYGALNNDSKGRHNVVGFVDCDKNKIGKKINRLKIYSLEQITPDFVKKKRVDEFIISIKSISPDHILETTDNMLALGLKVKIAPPLSKWTGGYFRVNQIRQIKINDLLNREPINIDNPIVKRDVRGKVILVTGAAGSIGSEISRQLSLYDYRHLVLIDQSESDLYDLQQELLQKDAKNITYLVSDIRDFVRMEEIFIRFKPDKVFHVAAYKHVPLMEQTPYQAVNTNIVGTKNIAKLSVEHNAERFVMISTDKAINPTNVMGATKRIAELYINHLSEQNTSTKFTITRFGNVIGSNGSVIPLFKKQIENGGPITVTHKDVIRFFMTATEACQLVLEAGTMGQGGEIYIFDMGKPVKIFDLAKKMIRLSGLNYPEDIDIKIIGLRPGEKLYEELLANGEDTQKTYHEKILIAKNRFNCSKDIIEKIEKLCDQNNNYVDKITVKLMKEIVPEYKSNNSEYEKLD